VRPASRFLSSPRAVAGALGLTISSFAVVSEACAVCATADVTLAPVEGEEAFRGRAQATLDAREGWVSAGGITVDDHRAELGLHYAPSETWLLSVGAPVLLRRIAGPGVPRATRVAAGDVELRADHVYASWLAGGYHQRFGVFAAVKLPTAPLENDGNGTPLSSVLQPGCGSLVPAVGVDYAIGRKMLSFTSSVSAWLPFAIRDSYHAGDSIRAGARGQWQPIRILALRLGGNLDLEAEGELMRGHSDPSSGGLLGYLAAEVVATPYPDFVVTAGALYPALAFLSGDHREGPVASMTLGYDF